MSDDLISRKAVIEENVDKVRVSSAEIVVHGTKENPYYEIEYFDLSDNEIHIGFSSYKLDVVFGYLEKYFDIVNEKANRGQSHNHIIGDLISRKSLVKNLNKFAPEYYTALVNDLIMKEQTAFDKEKVIEKLQRRSHNYYPSIDHYCLSRKAVDLKDAIEIVEKGGIE